MICVSCLRYFTGSWWSRQNTNVGKFVAIRRLHFSVHDVCTTEMVIGLLMCTAFVHLKFAWFLNKGFLREGIHAEFNQDLKGRWIALAYIPREEIVLCYTFALLAGSCRCNWRLNLAIVGVVWMRIELSSLPGLHWVHPANRFIFVSEVSGYFDYVREIDLSWKAAIFFCCFLQWSSC